MTAAAQMRGVAPFLLVADVKAAAAYYVDKLGFTTPNFWGEPPMFTIANRDDISVMLRQVRAGESFRPNAVNEDCLDAYFWVRDADALHDEFAAKGATIVCAPHDEPYDMREFQVRDPDGHVLTFGHQISGAANG